MCIGFIKILFAIVFALFCFQYGRQISFETHMNIYETLLTASGILFGVFGLWVSILYPGILEKSLNESGKKEKVSDISQEADRLLRPMFESLLLFLIMIAIKFIAPFIRELDMASEYRLFIKGISASIASVIFVPLIISIFQAVGQTEAFQSRVTRNAVSSDMKHGFMSGIRRKNK